MAKKIEKESGLGFVVNVSPPSGKGQSLISADLGVLWTSVACWCPLDHFCPSCCICAKMDSSFLLFLGGSPGCLSDGSMADFETFSFNVLQWHWLAHSNRPVPFLPGTNWNLLIKAQFLDLSINKKSFLQLNNCPQIFSDCKAILRGQPAGLP